VEIVVVDDYETLSQRGADFIAGVVQRHPRALLGLATGQTPVGVYQELVHRARAGLVDLSQVTIVCIDDYLGVSLETPYSLCGWLYRLVVQPLGLRPAQFRRMPADAPDPASAAAAFEAELRERGGLDLLVLGLGANGHIAFNEPGSPPDSRTRVVDLAPETRASNARYWPHGVAVPAQGLTMGIATLLEARAILLLVSGAGKAEILARALEGPITPAVPASYLQTHPRLTVLVDRAAAARLRRVSVGQSAGPAQSPTGSRPAT
jgi:glucosamine-6-phosphate deaminase